MLPATIGICVLVELIVGFVVGVAFGRPACREVGGLLEPLAAAVLRRERCFGIEYPACLVGVFATHREPDGVENRHGGDHSACGIAHDGGGDVVRFEDEVGHGGFHFAHVLPQDDHFVVTQACLPLGSTAIGLGSRSDQG